MDHELLAVISRIAVALLIGGLIGFEREFHGRPAGFRTHALVSVASALLMLVTVYQSAWMTATPLEAIRTDPTRMAQDATFPLWVDQSYSRSAAPSNGPYVCSKCVQSPQKAPHRSHHYGSGS